MLLYERFGISKAGIDPQSSLKGLHMMEAGAKKGDRQDLASLAQERTHIALRYYLTNDLANSRKHARGVVPAALAYLFGNWRTKCETDEGTINPSWWRSREYWMDAFRSALFWGSVLDEWVLLKKIAAYPDEHRRMKEIDTKPAYRQLLLEIAAYLRSERVAKVGARVNGLAGSKWHGTNVLAASLDAIMARNESVFNELLNEFLTAHHRRRPGRLVTDTISMDGTLIVKLAGREGLAVTVDPGLELYLVTLP